MMNMDHYRRMAVFARVVKLGGFTRAAESLELAPSAISQTIAALERDLGVRLINRSTRSISLTPAGEVFYADCVRMVEAAEAGLQGVAEEAHELSGRLTIACASLGAQAYGVPLVAFLAKAHPRLQLELRVSDRLIDLATEKIDIAVRTGFMRDSDLVARKLADLPEVLVASPDYLRSAPPLRSLGDLARHPLVCYSGFVRPSWVSVRELNARAFTELALKSGVTTDSSLDAMLLVKAGLGLGRFPRMALGPLLQGGELVELPFELRQGAGIYAVTLRRDELPKKVRIALAALKQIAAAAA